MKKGIFQQNKFSWGIFLKLECASRMSLAKTKSPALDRWDIDHSSSKKPKLKIGQNENIFPNGTSFLDICWNLNIPKDQGSQLSFGQIRASLDRFGLVWVDMRRWNSKVNSRSAWTDASASRFLITALPESVCLFSPCSKVELPLPRVGPPTAEDIRQVTTISAAKCSVRGALCYAYCRIFYNKICRSQISWWNKADLPQAGENIGRIRLIKFLSGSKWLYGNWCASMDKMWQLTQAKLDLEVRAHRR